MKVRENVTFKTLVVLSALLMANGMRTGAGEAGCRSVRADAPLILDGKLDEDFWQRAESHGSFTILGEDGKVAGDTVFRVAYDDAWLYIGMDCANPNMEALQPIIRGHDQGACNDESIELFLDPGTDGGMYLHYMLSFANAKDERRVTGSGLALHRDIQWDVPWRSATHARPAGWSAEVALPLYVLASYGSLDKIRVNIARNRRVPVIDAQLVVVDEKRESSAWSPVIRGFHEQERFRPLTGLADIQLEIPSLARIAAARVLPYAARDGGTVYEVEAQVRSFNRQRSDLVLSLADRPVVGTPRTIERTLELDEPVTRTLTISVPVETVSAREAILTLADRVRGETLETVFVEDMSALNVMTAFLDRNYYTSEEHGLAVCQIGLPLETLAGMRIEVRDASGAVLGALDTPAAECRVPFPLHGLSQGESAIDVALVSSEGADFFTVALTAVKRESKPGLEWKIDQERRVLLKNGEPFFSFGMCMTGAAPDDDEAYRRLAEHGFNTFMVFKKGTSADMVQYQRRAAEHGLFVIAHPDYCVTNITWDIYANYSGDLLNQVKRATARQSLIALKGVMSLPIPIAERNAIYGEFYYKNIDGLIDVVRKIKDFDNLIGYFILDEPLAKTYFDQYKFGQDYYARIHRADGYHPVFVNYSSYIPEGDEFVNWCDVLMTDPYWSPPAAEGTRTTPNHVSKITWMTDQRALKYRQPNFQVLAGPLWSGCKKRALTHDEQCCQTYLALIHRATAILYYSDQWVRPPNWATFKQLGAEMKVLAPFILGPSVPGEPVYRRALLDKADEEPVFEDDPFDPLREKYPVVQVLLLADSSGAQVLLAANARHYPVACRFEIEGLTGLDSMFDPITPVVAAAAFADTLEPYATRAWRIRTGKPIESNAALMVLQTILVKNLPNPETLLPDCWRPDCKNVLPNPVFERDTAGVPHYCLVSPGVAVQKGDAMFGENCLKFKRLDDSTSYEFLHAACAPQHDRPLTYTFSLYMKGSRKGLKAWIRGTEMNPDKTWGETLDVPLTTSWKRYAITGVIPAKASVGSMFEVRLMEPGVMWVDGLQLEQGAEATEFEQ